MSQRDIHRGFCAHDGLQSVTFRDVPMRHPNRRFQARQLMSLHSFQWPTNPNYPAKHAVRDCAYNMAWHKFEEGHRVTDAVQRQAYKAALRDIVSHLCDHGDLDTIMLSHRAYAQLLKRTRY
jgi:hypothetical protein